MGIKYSFDEIKQKVRDVGSEFLDDFYVNNTYKHRFKCSVCGKEYINTFTCVTNKKHSKNKCENCSKKLRKSNRISEEKFNKYKQIFMLKNKIEIITPYSEYQRNSQKLKCKCLICDEVFYKNVSNMQSGQMHGCLFVSKGERIVLTYFENNGIQYNYQVALPNGLISDFEILLENGLIHLEINGDQHYEYNKRYFHSHEEFLQRLENDRIKNEYYLKLGYENISIRYQLNGKNNDDIMLTLNDIFEEKYGKVKTKEKNLSFDEIEFSLKNGSSKKILCYDIEGNFIKEYNSILEASIELIINRSTISDCIEGKFSRAKNYIFRDYRDNYALKIQPYTLNRKCKKIISYRIDGSLYKIYDSIMDASRELNIDDYLIGCAIDKVNRRAGNYMFITFKKDYSSKIEAYIENKIIIEVYKNNEFFKRYESINKAHKELGFSRKLIGKALLNNEDINGYTFKKVS